MKKKKMEKSLLIGIFIIPVFMLIISVFIKEYELVQSSMSPAYNDGDIVIVLTKKAFDFNKLGHNDVVIINEENEQICKRIAAVPGDIIIYNDGYLFLKNADNKNSILNENKPIETFLGQIGNREIKINENEYFVLGDNVQNSVDSTEFGPVNKDQIIGKVIFPIK